MIVIINKVIRLDMSSLLSKEEIDFLKKIEQEKIKHREAQAKYRLKHLEQTKEYNKKYYEEKRDKINALIKKVPPPPPTPINVKEITKPPKIDRRTRQGKKQAVSVDIIPSYKKRKTALEPSTVEQYISNANTIQKLFTGKGLSQKAKGELRKLSNDNEDLNEKLLLDEMDYINDNIDKTIDKLRDHYKNDNTFRSYIIVLTVITSHLKTINPNIYQTLSKTGIFMNETVQKKRKKNILDEKDKGKIIDLDRTTILSNIQNKLDKIDEKLIYSIYTLLPARRLEWRFMKLTTEKNLSKLEDPVNNYLMVLPKNNYKLVFNNYKTYKTYGQQVFDVEDDELREIISQYITEKGLTSGDYLFSLTRNKKEIMSQSNFSKKISEVFLKIYKISLTIRFLRMSWVSNLMETNPTEEEKETLAYFMGHSREEQGKYNKIS